MKTTSLKVNRYRIGGDLAPVWITYSTARKLWILVEEYRVTVGKEVIAIPQGFEFDLASIPRVFWRLIAPFELSIVAPLVHDYLYANEGRIPDVSMLESMRDSEIPTKAKVHYVLRYTREDADNVFLKLMEKEGIPKLKREAAFRAVRWFGPRW